MTDYPYLPLFVSDHLAETDHLSDAEHGVYLRLILLLWQSPECRIPDDNEWLARRFRRDANAVQTQVRPLIHEFCQVRRGWVTKPNLKAQWEWCRTKSVKNAKAAKSRWNKEKDQSERIANGHSEWNASTPLHSKIVKSNGSGSVNSVNKGVKESNKEPKHCAKTPDSAFIYCRGQTSEFEVYAADFEKATGQRPEVNAFGGRWFKLQGEKQV